MGEHEENGFDGRTGAFLIDQTDDIAKRVAEMALAKAGCGCTKGCRSGCGCIKRGLLCLLGCGCSGLCSSVAHRSAVRSNLKTNISMVHNDTVVGCEGYIASSTLMHQLKGTDALASEKCFESLNEVRSSVQTESDKSCHDRDSGTESLRERIGCVSDSESEGNSASDSLTAM